MNKKFSTLLAVALMGTFSANAINNNELYRLSAGNGKVLSVQRNAAKTADSLVVVDAPAPDKIMAESYKKALWKFTKGNTDNTTATVWTITNYATGSVLSLDLSKSGASFVSGGQSQWLVSDVGAITAIKGGKTYALYLSDVKDKDGKPVTPAKQEVLVGKDKTATNFTMSQPANIPAMTAAQINGLYGTSSSLDFVKTLAGNPIDGVPFHAADIEGSNGYVTLRLNTGKYAVVDSTVWTNSVNDYNYWKLTTDAKPSKLAKQDNVAAGLTGVLENGRMPEFYGFKISLNIAKGYLMTIYPQAVPVYKNTEKKGEQTKFSFGFKTTTRALVYGKFADSKEVITATSVLPAKDKLSDALATFGVVEAPDALDPEYTYYVQDYKMYTYKAATNKWLKNKNYKKFYALNCEGTDKTFEKKSLEAPSYMWYLVEDASMSNMMETTVSISENSSIYLIDEEAGLYAFGEDTVKLTKGPKVADARKMGYKVVTKEDEVNGALSFRLVSSLADDLYMVSKNNVLYVANSTLADAQKMKVVAAEETEGEYAEVGNKVIMPKYYITNRLGNKLLAKKANGEFAFVSDENEALVVSFLAVGKDNQHKIVYDVNGEMFAITANAATGILEEDGVCATDRVIFEFATKPAPTYGAPAVGHVQITTLEDDNKMLANQKDGFAALKAEGQSILKSEQYTSDTLTMWLDTACVEFDKTMPLYYISTKTFTPDAKDTRNFLINPANIVAAIEANNADPDNDKLENKYEIDAATNADEVTHRAAFNAASVCGLDSIAINGDTINIMPLNPAAVAFEVAAEVNDESYRIVSKLKAVNEDYDANVEGSLPYVENTDDLYLAQLNNVLFWTSDFYKAEIFVINRASAPTANESIEAESSVKVLGANGSVVVLGAAGKNVTVATVLGKTVASQVIASDNATIAAPAGVVFVTVDGETTKVVVK